jgi:hypothetical protein
MGCIIEIEVSESENGLITSPRVSKGDTVVWIFKGDLAQQDLEVRAKSPSSFFDTLPLKGRGQIRQQVSQGIVPGDTFEYVIAKSGETRPLPWADSRNGVCMKQMDPPR